MKTIKGFVLRTVMGEAVIVGEGAKQVNFNKIISLNESAALLWKAVEDKEFTVDDLAGLLVENYNIPREVALVDAAEIAQAWVSVGIVEE